MVNLDDGFTLKKRLVYRTIPKSFRLEAATQSNTQPHIQLEWVALFP